MSRSKSIFSVALLILLISFAAGCGCDAGYYVHAADQHFAKGRFGDAVVNYRKAIQKDSNSGDAYFGLGRALAKTGGFSEAYQSLQRAEQLLPNREYVRIELGDFVLVAYLGDPNRSQALYVQLTRISTLLLAQNPKSADGLRFRGELLLTDRKLPEAAALFEQANAIRPMDPKIVGPWVETLLQDNRDAEGEKLAWQLIEARKDFALIYEVLYAHFMARKQYSEGEKVIQTRIRNNPSSDYAILQLAYHFHHQQPALVPVTLQRILDAPKTFPEGYLHVGEFYTTLDRPDEAMRVFRDGMKVDSGNKKIYMTRIAGVQIAQKHVSEAIGTVQEILNDNPSDRDARAMHALLLIESGKPESLNTAIAELQALIKDHDNDTTLHNSLGRAYLFKNDLDSARKEFQATARIKPSDIPSRLALLQISVKNNAYGEILRYSNELLALDPKNPPARFWGAVAKMGVGSNDQARTDLNAFLKDYPDSKDASLQLGLLDVKEKRFKDAEVIFRRSYQSNNPDSRAFEGLVRTYVGQNDLDTALQTAQSEVRSSPNSVPAHALLAAVAVAAGKTATALDEYQWLASRDPKNPVYLIQMAQAYQAGGDLGRALETFQKAEQIAPRNGQIVAAIAFILDATGRRAEAKASYQKALQLEPENSSILNNLAFLLADTHDNLDEALRLVKEAQRRAPTDSGVADTLAWIYVQKNYNDGAIQILSKLVKDHPTDSGYRYHLGVACFQSGDKKRAKAELESALSNQPDKDTATRIQALIAKI